MEIYDTHTHVAFESKLFKDWANERMIDFTLNGLLEEMKGSGVTKALVFASYLNDIRLTNDELLKIVEGHPELVPVASIEEYPEECLLDAATKQLKDSLSTAAFKAVKIYTGYWWRDPNDSEYQNIYDACKDAKVPVIFHTGDTLDNKGLLETSHPFKFDRLAVNNRDLTIVLAHCGHPFIKEAASVVYKNPNVYADLAVSVAELNLRSEEDYFRNLANEVKQAFDYAGIKKFMYASDWPLISMKKSLESIRRIQFSGDEWGQITYENAKKVFKL